MAELVIILTISVCETVFRVVSVCLLFIFAASVSIFTFICQRRLKRQLQFGWIFVLSEENEETFLLLASELDQAASSVRLSSCFVQPLVLLPQHRWRWFGLNFSPPTVGVQQVEPLLPSGAGVNGRGRAACELSQLRDSV